MATGYYFNLAKSYLNTNRTVIDQHGMKGNDFYKVSLKNFLLFHVDFLSKLLSLFENYLNNIHFDIFFIRQLIKRSHNCVYF